MFNSKIQRYGKIRTKWRLFHAMDFHSLMFPCFSFCRILGMFPYKINATTFEFSRPHYVLSTAIICVCCILELTIIYDIAISKIIYFGDTSRNFEAVCCYMCSGFIVITTYVFSGPRMRVLQTILEISLKLPSESYQKLSRLIHGKDVLGTIFLIVQLCMFFSKTPIFELTCQNVLIILFTMYVELLTFQMNMLYINCICILKACFKKINDNLIYFRKSMINDIKPCIPKLIWHMERRQFMLIELKIIKKQHLTACETVQKLNVTFSMQLVAITIMTFFEITFELYSYIVRWKDGIFISLNWQFFYVLLTSMTFYIMKLTLLVWACETSKNQEQKIRTSVHDLHNSVSDKKIKCELQLFSLQILQHKNTFSGKGLTVDATLLTAMVGSITTYMLILIQFLITSHVCNGKPVIQII